MSDSPPPYVPGQSSFRRFLNWAMPAPDQAYVRLILGAVCDIRICQEIFDGWTAQLDKLSSEKSEERERVLRHHLALLREDVGWCSRATDAILLCHAQFAYLMAQRIDDASRHTTRLANDINKASRALSEHSMAKRILGWLKNLFNALANIFALGSLLSPFLHSIAPGISFIAPAASTLWKAAAAFCGTHTRRERIGDHRVRDPVP
ncbi:hypothetical protein EI94DRAFT_1723673 [Lactarius quietus]|nr:hypothetical protein EI94DRAFT_1723673 [Lactarius quietus]